MAKGSEARTVAPSAIRRRTTSIAGAKRTSSVFGLKARPRTPTVFSFTTQSARRTFSTNCSIRLLLTASTSLRFATAATNSLAAASNCSAAPGGLGLSAPTCLPSALFQTRTCPLQSPAITRAPSWVKTARSARSGNASKTRC